LDVLKRFDENQGKSYHDHNLLVLNTTNTSDVNDGMLLSANSELWETLEPSLNKLHNSLNAVANTLECEDARKFIKNVQEENEEKLQKPDLSQLRLYYYQSVRNITENTLLKIEGCN